MSKNYSGISRASVMIEQVRNSELPSGMNFLMLALNKPNVAEEVLDNICQVINDWPETKEEIADLFSFPDQHQREVFLTVL